MPAPPASGSRAAAGLSSGMPPQTIDALLRSVRRGDVAPAYYFHGSEDVLKEEAVRAVVDRVLDPGLRDFNLDQRSAAQADPEEVYSLCRTPAMMADRRVVILRDVEAWKRKTKARTVALDYLAKPSSGSVLLLIQGAGDEKEDKDLARLAVSVACEPLPPERAARWVHHRAKRLGIEVESAAAEALVRAVGADLGALASELEKLAAVSEAGPIGPDRVAALVGIRHGETQYDWRDAIFEGDPGRAARLLEPVLDQAGVTGVKLLTLLGTTLVGLGVARAAYDGNARGSRLEDAVFRLLLRARSYGLPSYKEEAKRWARWAPAWPPARIRGALGAALAADTALKNTTISDERGVLLDLVLRIGVTMPEAV
jgi:DNA polymerase-3 subunit delta